MRYSVLIALLIALGAPSAAAHGGQYKPPSDAGAGGSGHGFTAGPPTNPQGSGTPMPGAPDGVGSRSDGRGGDGRGTKRPVRSGLEIGEVTSGWENWWDANKDRYLDLSHRALAGTRTRSGPRHMTGLGRQGGGEPTRRPDASRVQGEVLPLLRELSAEGLDRDLVDSSVLALARSSRADSAAATLAVALPLLAHDELSVQTSAVLSLGVLGSPLAVEPLTALASDSSQGRTLAGGRGPVPELARAFAALSLGLIGHAPSVDTLRDLLAASPDTDLDLKACAIVALGQMDNERSPEAARILVGLLADPQLDAVLKSYVPTALGKLCSRGAEPDPTVLPALLETFTARDTDAMVRQSAAIALGLLGSIPSGESRDSPLLQALLDFVTEGKDAGTRQFCLIALAQIAARDEDPAAHAPAHDAILTVLAREITRPSTAENRPWAVLAAALLGHEQPDARADLALLVQEAYASEKNPAVRAACALGLGLLDVQTSAETLFEDFQRSTDPTFKGYAALALGFLGHTDAAERLRVECQAKTITPSYRMQVATALGLLCDREAVAVLSETLVNAQTLGVSAAVAKALGLIGDESALAPLMALAADGERTPLTRAFACVALGRLCEKTGLPWNQPIMADNNYLVTVPAIAEVCDIL